MQFREALSLLLYQSLNKTAPLLSGKRLDFPMVFVAKIKFFLMLFQEKVSGLLDLRRDQARNVPVVDAEQEDGAQRAGEQLRNGEGQPHRLQSKQP